MRRRIGEANLLLGNMRLLISATFLLSVFMFIALFRELPLTFLLIWFGAFVVLTCTRIWHFRACLKTSLNEHNIDRTLREFQFFTFVAGALWGTLGYVGVTDENVTISIMILMVLTGIIATATATISHIMPMYLSFILPLLLPTAYKFYSIGEPLYYWISFLILFYLIVSLIGTRRIRKLIKQSFDLRFENLDLIEDLQAQNRKTEEALNKVEQISDAKSSFFAAASHDLRQPLHSLGLFTATLGHSIKDDQQKALLKQVDDSVKTLEELFNAILDISSLDAGTIPVNKSHFELGQQLMSLEREVRSLCEEAGLQCDFDIGEYFVFTDAILLERALRNLVANAIRYTETGTVTVKAEKVKGKIKVSIVDTGKGISDENQQRVFEEYVQLDNPERDRTKGLGLGLSIVQRISSLLNFELIVDSTLGEGTSFIFYLEPGDPTLSNAGNAMFSPADAKLSSMFVLVIDDEEQVRAATEAILLSWKCEVMVAKSSDEAIAQLKEYDYMPDVLISDFRLRNNERGTDAIAGVRQFCGDYLPAIILTGDIAQTSLIEISNAGFPTLHKPCKAAELKALLRAVQGTEKCVNG